MDISITEEDQGHIEELRQEGETALEVVQRSLRALRERQCGRKPVLYGSSYVAPYLDTSMGSLHNWTMKEPEGFLVPEAVITGLDGTPTARGWSEYQLPLMRRWRTERMGLGREEAVSHWNAVNEAMASRIRIKRDKVHPNQLTINEN
jgi:hypothetical protein